VIFATLVSAWIMGSVGSTHCVVMCGGAASTISGSVVKLGRKPRVTPTTASLAYNAGRIASYSVAGAIAGAIGIGIDRLPFVMGAEIALRFFAGLLLCAIGLYIAGVWRRGAAFERIGLPLWRRLEPFARRLIPIRSVGSALALGALWGWMPCGLVYAALGIALASGTPIFGALTMIAFGIGTLPALLLTALFGARLGVLANRAVVRRVAGITILLFGLFHVAAASAQVTMPLSKSHACCIAKQASP
jgi:sulfite exporter TauE/SafE